MRRREETRGGWSACAGAVKENNTRVFLELDRLVPVQIFPLNFKSTEDLKGNAVLGEL